MSSDSRPFFQVYSSSRRAVEPGSDGLNHTANGYPSKTGSHDSLKSRRLTHVAAAFSFRCCSRNMLNAATVVGAKEFMESERSSTRPSSMGFAGFSS